MKRALVLLLIIAICVAGYLSIWGYLPCVPAIGAGMEPEIRSGSLLVTRTLEPAAIVPGELVVFNVPRIYREGYGYPPVVARRVASVDKSLPGWQIQTAADSAGNDPFLIRMADIRGSVSSRVPYLGLPLLFLQNRAGTYFVVVAIILFAFFLYSNEIAGGLRRRYRDFLSPIVDETHRVSLVLSNRFEGTEKALEGFAGAMQQYAVHMASHTSAIQGLSEASQALKNSAIEQNQILASLSRTMETEKTGQEVARVERVVSDLEKRTLMVLQARDELEGRKPAPAYKLPKRISVSRPAPPAEAAFRKEPLPDEEESATIEVIKSPPGCRGNPRALYARAHLFTKPAG
jgi:hypothetical protein